MTNYYCLLDKTTHNTNSQKGHEHLRFKKINNSDKKIRNRAIMEGVSIEKPEKFTDMNLYMIWENLPKEEKLYLAEMLPVTRSPQMIVEKAISGMQLKPIEKKTMKARILLLLAITSK